jgi:hypothetical protein
MIQNKIRKNLHVFKRQHIKEMLNKDLMTRSIKFMMRLERNA